MSSSFRCQPWAKRHDPLVGEAAELVADHLVVGVEAGGAEAGGALGLEHQLDEAGAGGVGVAAGDQGRDRGGAEGGERGSRPRSAGRAISICDIGMPPASWARYSPEPICRISRSVSPRRPSASSARGPAGELAERLGVGRHPGEAVGGELVGLERGGRRCGRRC